MATAKKDKGRGNGPAPTVTAAPTQHGDRGHGQGRTGGQREGAGRQQSQNQGEVGGKGRGEGENSGGQGKAKGNNGNGSSQGNNGNGKGNVASGQTGGGRGSSSGSSATPTRTPTPVAVPATAVPVAAPATPAPATSSAPAAATPAPVSRPVAGTRERSRTAQGRAGVTTTATAGRGTAAGAAAGVAAATAVAPVATGTAAAAAASGRAGGAHRVSQHGALARGATDGSPVARTAERIVSVIPWPMWVLIGVLAAMTLALGTRSWIGDRQRRRLREDVGLLQSALLPVVPASLAAVATSAAYRPAEGPGAGGDFYDVFELGDGGLGVVVGDLSGHGREMLSQTALTRYTLRAYLEAGMAPRAALRTASGVLGHQLDVAFATVALATYDPRSRTLTYALAGHPPPLVVGPDGSVPPVTAAASAPLAAGLTTGIRQTTLVLPGEATVCFYTDGLIEARVDGDLFGVERLERTLAQLGPDATAAALLAGVSEQTDHRPDDMAACVLGVAGARLAPSERVEELEVDAHELADDRLEDFLRACGLPGEEVLRVLVAAAATLDHADAAVLRVTMTDSSPTVRVDPSAREGLSVLAPEPLDERSLP